MKEIAMGFKKSILTFIVSTIFMSDPKAQVVLEVDGGVGYTAMNMESWAEREPMDWSQFAKQVNAQALYRKSNFAFGVSYGYNYLFWAYVRIPYGNTVINRTYEGSAQKLML